MRCPGPLGTHVISASHRLYTSISWDRKESSSTRPFTFETRGMVVVPSTHASLTNDLALQPMFPRIQHQPPPMRPFFKTIATWQDLFVPFPFSSLMLAVISVSNKHGTTLPEQWHGWQAMSTATRWMDSSQAQERGRCKYELE